MDGPMNRVRRSLGAVAVVVLLVACGGEEQGGLEGSSPGPAAVVGGDIDQFELFFDDIVVAIDGTVTDPNGAELAAEWVLDTDIRVLVKLDEALSEPGEYDVVPIADAVDGDRVEESFSFTFDPAAADPQLVFDSDGESGFPWLLWLVGALGVALVAVVGRQFLVSMARLRSAQRTTPPDA
jgi:hypothetical protein